MVSTNRAFGNHPQPSAMTRLPRGAVSLLDLTLLSQPNSCRPGLPRENTRGIVPRMTNSKVLLRASVPWLLAVVVFLALLAGCSDKRKVPAESTTPVVGIMELAVSGRTGDPAPSNPLHIEVAPDRIRLDAHTVVHLSDGTLAAADQVGGIIPKLAGAIGAGPARSSAALMVHVETPFDTLVAILATLKQQHIAQIGFEVRKRSTANTGFIDTASYDVSAPTDPPQPFAAPAQRTWDEMTAVWQQMHDACSLKDQVDCDLVPNPVAQGGQLAITLWVRGNGLKVHLTRFGGPDAAAPKPQAAAMLDGVPAPQAGAADDQEPPATEAAFTWRAEAATEDASPISGTMRNLCGTRPCGSIVLAQGDTLTARVLSFIGAAYPDGTPKPDLRFEIEH